MRVSLVAGLGLALLLLVSAVALLPDDEAAPLVDACAAAPDSLDCRVGSELGPALHDYLAAVDRAVDPPDLVYNLYRLLPRLAAADGRLVEAAELAVAADRLRGWGLFGSPDPRAFAAAPLAASHEEAAELERAARDAPPWVRLGIARALAAGGEKARARALFAETAREIAGEPFGADPALFALWSAAGFADDALAHVVDWPPLPAAEARLGVARGLAMRGEAAATVALVESLPGALALTGAPAVAEALRRAGRPGEALAVLDEASRRIAAEAPWLADDMTRKRFAQAHALLGDFEGMRRVAGRSLARDNAHGDFWPAVAPAVACRDPGLAFALLAQPDAKDVGRWSASDPEVFEVLVAAAASGHGEAALAAVGDDPASDRTLLLTAVAIGLLQARAVPPDALPCSTLMLF